MQTINRRSIAQVTSRLGFNKSDGTANTKGWWLSTKHDGTLVLNYAPYGNETDHFYSKAVEALTAKGYRVNRVCFNKLTITK